MAMNAEASAIEHDLRRPIFTTFHGSVSIAVALFAIASSFVSTMAGTFATSLLGVIVVSLAWLMVYVSVPARVITAGKAGGLSNLPSKLPLIIMGLAIGLSVAAETSSLFWSAKLLNDQAPELAAIAGLGRRLLWRLQCHRPLSRRPPARQIWRDPAHAGLAGAGHRGIHNPRPVALLRPECHCLRRRRLRAGDPLPLPVQPGGQPRCRQTAPPA